jgi:hypothetical protein
MGEGGVGAAFRPCRSTRKIRGKLYSDPGFDNSTQKRDIRRALKLAEQVGDDP